MKIKTFEDDQNNNNQQSINKYGIDKNKIVPGTVVLFEQLPLKGNGRFNDLTKPSKNHQFLVIEEGDNDNIKVIASTSNAFSRYPIVTIDNRNIKDFEIRKDKELSHYNPYSIGTTNKKYVKKILGTLRTSDFNTVMNHVSIDKKTLKKKGISLDILEQLFKRYNI